VRFSCRPTHAEPDAHSGRICVKKTAAQKIASRHHRDCRPRGHRPRRRFGATPCLCHRHLARKLRRPGMACRTTTEPPAPRSVVRQRPQPLDQVAAVDRAAPVVDQHRRDGRGAEASLACAAARRHRLKGPSQGPPLYPWTGSCAARLMRDQGRAREARDMPRRSTAGSLN